MNDKWLRSQKLYNLFESRETNNYRQSNFQNTLIRNKNGKLHWLHTMIKNITNPSKLEIFSRELIVSFSMNYQFRDNRYSKVRTAFRSWVKLKWHLFLFIFLSLIIIWLILEEKESLEKWFRLIYVQIDRSSCINNIRTLSNFPRWKQSLLNKQLSKWNGIE
jgi:hypothetical protein